MTTTSHALTGALIATVIKQPLLAIPLAYFSHYACDSLPHFGINMKFGSRAMYIWLIVDGMCAALFAILLIILGVKNPLYLALAGFAAMSPDLVWLYYGIRGDLTKPHKFDWLTKLHSKIQWYQKVPGIVVDVTWVVFMTILTLRLQ